ncbi:chemoreceptor glutamine deamidase CheD [Alteromonas hispanica]|uniref:Probable chemoreceptor glutamine deamidase CheD n=1 Tax=Alteromonas hispanica TaxID=315421 RepID=A0A6L9MU75_9ALTE|nr:chemoreceptor glutamine deamidase CheD [Alteromonas hispanica]NDW21738.1 chemoreceptor glutamine deamidase CheD [Alteromonas hispanica]
MIDELGNTLYADRYYDTHFANYAVKILPGEFYATNDDTMIVTVLGSCVAVCLYDAIKKVRGMNHFLLPNDETTRLSLIPDSARYGCFAMELLINQMLKLGAEKRNLTAKVFGGGNVMKGFIQNNVGERNVEFTFDYLKQEQIPVLASDVLNFYPRKVYFSADNGVVNVKKIRSLNNTTILDRESEYRLRLRQSNMANDIDLFKSSS